MRFFLIAALAALPISASATGRDEAREDLAYRRFVASECGLTLSDPTQRWLMTTAGPETDADKKTFADRANAEMDRNKETQIRMCWQFRDLLYKEGWMQR